MSEFPTTKRVAMISRLAELSGGGGLGRTALMKLIYLIQTVREAPLGYKFGLYTYGPYSAEVLEELKLAEIFGGVKVKHFVFGNGMGYSIIPGENASTVQLDEHDFLKQHEDDLEWAVSTFGRRNAADLEMVSTIVYVDRSAFAQDQRLSNDHLIDEVAAIKPHLDRERIRREVDELLTQDVLRATG